MKRIFAVLSMLLMLTLSAAAFAEADLSDWAEVQMGDVGLHFYRPADFNVSEAPETDGGENCSYFASNALMNFAIYCIGTNDQTLADISDSLVEAGYTVNPNGLAEYGMPYEHLMLTVEGSETFAAVVFQGSDGYFYDFECEELADGGLYTFGMMLSTISAME